MNILHGLEQMIRLGALAWVDLRRGRIAAMLLALASLHVVALIMAADPTFPLWGGVLVPFFHWRFGDFYLHYPQALIGLPVTGSALRIAVDVLAGPWIAGWVAVGVLATATRKPLRDSHQFRGALRSYPRIMLYLLVAAGVWVLLYALPITTILEERLLSYRLRQLVVYGMGVIPALVLAPLFYFVPEIASGSSGVWGAVRQSRKGFRSSPWMAVAIGAVPYLAGLPFVVTLHRSAALARQLRPEIVLALMVLQSLVAILSSYYVVSSSVRLWCALPKAKR